MLNTQEAQSLLSGDGEVVGSDGAKIGKVGQVFLDDETGQPAWVTVKTGMFGGAESFVPLDAGSMDGDDVKVPYDKDKVKDAPRVADSDSHLSVEEEDTLYEYYGLGNGSNGRHTDTVVTDGRVGDVDERRVTDTDTYEPGDGVAGGVAGGTRAAGHDTSGPDTDTAMTRSEEQLHVGKTSETVGRARLRKYIVTENVTKTVPVSHEEVRIEREPITDANRGDAVSGGDLTEEDHEVELSAERVVVDKDTVPVERVQMGTETVTEDQVVDEEVRKERIEAEGDITEGHAGTPRATDGR